MSQQRNLPVSMAHRITGRLESRKTQKSVAECVAGACFQGYETVF